MGTPISNMKYFVLSVAAIVAVSGSGVPTCDECKSAAAGIVEHLLSEESIGEQVKALKELLCPMVPFPDCEDALDTYYPDMASCTFIHLILEQDVCTLLGLGSAMRVAGIRDWTCDECNDFLKRTPDYMVEEETVAEAVAYLQG